jgi:hypothetical protein
MMLTTQRIILANSRDLRFQPQMFPLADILSVKTGETPRGEPVISLMVIDTNEGANPQPLTLIFSRQYWEPRKQECDEWVKKIMENIVCVRQKAAGQDKVMPVPDQELGMQPSIRRWSTTDIIRPHTTIVSTPPAEDEIILNPDQPEFPPIQKPVISERPAGKEPTIPTEEIPEHEKLKIPEKIIAEKIHSTTGLISSDLVIAEQLVLEEIPESSEKVTLPTSPAEIPPVPTDELKEFTESVVHQMPVDIEPLVPLSREETLQIIPPSSPPPSYRSNGRTLLAIGAIIIIICTFIGGAFIWSFSISGNNAPVLTPDMTPTPQPLQTFSPPTPVAIPTNGVWVRINYPKNFIGWIGNPGMLQPVSGSGEFFYKITNNENIVEISVQKQDESGETLSVEVIRNGEIISNRTIRTPMGSIDILIDVRTKKPPGMIAITPDNNATNSQQRWIEYF